jgi:hypothetical protein
MFFVLLFLLLFLLIPQIKTPKASLVLICEFNDEYFLRFLRKGMLEKNKNFYCSSKFLIMFVCCIHTLAHRIDGRKHFCKILTKQKNKIISINIFHSKYLNPYPLFVKIFFFSQSCSFAFNQLFFFSVRE